MNDNLPDFIGIWRSTYLLLLRGADASSLDSNGYTPLHFAVQEANGLADKNGESFSNYMKVIEMLLQSSKNIDAKPRVPAKSLTTNKGKILRNENIFLKI